MIEHFHIASPSSVGGLPHHHFHGLVDRETAGPLARWKSLERRQVTTHDRLGGQQDERVLNEPGVVPAGLVLRALEGIGPQS